MTSSVLPKSPWDAILLETMLCGPYPQYSFPLYKTYIRPHLEYAIQATYPILCRVADALEKVQKLALKFVNGLRHVPYEASLKQLCLFPLTHRRIRGDLIAMFRLPMVSWNSSWHPPSSIQPAKGYAATHSSSINSDAVCAVANSPSPFGLSHFGRNCRLR